MSPASVKRRAVALAKGMATAFLLGWSFSRLDLSRALALLGGAQLRYLFIPFATAVVVVGMGALRWQLLLGVLRLRRPSKQVCAETFISNFFNFFLPSKLGGEAVRAYYGVKITGRPGDVVLSIMIDRYVGLIGLMSLPLAVILLRKPTREFHDTVGVVYAAVSAALLVAVFVALLISRGSPTPGSEMPRTRAVDLLQDIRSALRLYSQRTGILLLALGISVAISLGGLGAREWIFVSLFAELGMPQQTALLISLLNLLINTGTGLIGAAVYLGWEYRPTH